MDLTDVAALQEKFPNGVPVGDGDKQILVPAELFVKRYASSLNLFEEVSNGRHGTLNTVIFPSGKVEALDGANRSTPPQQQSRAAGQ